MHKGSQHKNALKISGHQISNMPNKVLIANASEKLLHIKVILSGTGVRDLDRKPCESVTSVNESMIMSELEFDIEEADVRLILHAFHATQEMVK